MKRQREVALKRMAGAERAAQGGRRRPFLEFMPFEVADTIFGSEQALKMFLYGVKRARHVGNLVIGVLRPGLGCVPGVRSMADSYYSLYRNELGLVIKGVHPRFPPHLVAPDVALGAPRVSFVPQPG